MKRRSGSNGQNVPTTKKHRPENKLVPSVSTLKQALATWECGQYQQLHFGSVEVQLRRSIVPRRKDPRELDFDVVQIRTTPTRKGIGTEFLVNLIEAAGLLGRGVFLEQTISDDSEKWAEKLVRDGIMRPWIMEKNFLSTKRLVTE